MVSHTTRLVCYAIPRRPGPSHPDTKVRHTGYLSIYQSISIDSSNIWAQPLFSTPSRAPTHSSPALYHVPCTCLHHCLVPFSAVPWFVLPLLASPGFSHASRQAVARRTPETIAGAARALITNAWCLASPWMPAIPCPLRSTRPPPPPAPTALALGFPGHIIVLSLRPLARRRCRGVSCGWDCCCCRMAPARSRRSRRLQSLG